MATREYIGARYVPKFADPLAWQENSAYEALTVVQWNNNLYVSKVPVPTNVSPANAQYWVNWSVSSGVNEKVANLESWASTPGDILWSNPKPNVAFSAQDIRLPEMVNYELLLIEYVDTVYDLMPATPESSHGHLNLIVRPGQGGIEYRCVSPLQFLTHHPDPAKNGDPVSCVIYRYLTVDNQAKVLRFSGGHVGVLVADRQDNYDGVVLPKTVFGIHRIYGRS